MNGQVTIPIGLPDEDMGAMRVCVSDGVIMFNLDAKDGDRQSMWGEGRAPWRKLYPDEARLLAAVMLGMAALADNFRGGPTP